MGIRKPLWIAQLLILLSGGLALAQVTTGTVSGTVQDGSGGVLPGVTVTVRNEETGLSRDVVTDSTGRYSAPSLSSGSYRVTATLEGFKTGVRSGIVLTVGREAVVDLSLAPGNVEQTVEVQGDSPLVESTTASLGSLVDGRTIRQLPLNGRSYDQLALLQPGVTLTSPGQTGGAPFSFGTGKRFTVGGQRSTSNTFLLDGTVINDQGNGTPGGAAGTNLGVDTIQEFKIFTNSFKAEFGRSSGSVTTAITRSGTNILHGAAFGYLRNSELDAKNYFDTGNEPPPFHRHQYGGVLGGPIKRDKTFFFAGYEGFRQRLATTLTAVVPTAEAKQGILPTGTVPVNPSILPYLALYPLPNGRLFGDGTGEYRSSPSVPTNEDNFMGRVDHQLNAANQIFGRYTFDNDSIHAQQNLPHFSLHQASRRQYTTVQLNSILGPKAVNNFRFAFNRSHSTYDPIISDDVPPELSIIPGQPLGALQIGGLITSGARILTPLGSPNTGAGSRFWDYKLFEFADDYSYIAGKHFLKGGVDIQRIVDDTASGNFQRGGYTFPSFTAFLAATPSNLQAGSPLGALPEWRLRQTLFAAYAQDDYTVNSRVTLNLGLRFEAASDPIDADEQMAVLPSASSPAFVISDKYFSTGKDNFEPRVGLAWRVTDSGKTVLRTGAGLYHNQILPWLYSLNIFTPPFYGRFSLANPPFPNGYLLLKPGAPLAVARFSETQETPSSRQYNVSIQQQIFEGTVLQVAYAGNRADHLQLARELNTPIPTLINGDVTNPFYPQGAPRQNPAFAGILGLEMTGRSRYDSLTVTLRKQRSSGFQGQIFYTYAKAKDHNTSVSGSDSLRSPQTILNPLNQEGDWALSDFDVRHNMVGTFSLPLPSPASSKALGAVVNGWTLDGIATLQSGMPFTARLSSSVSRDLASTLSERPNLNPGFSANPTSGTSAGCPGFAAGTPVGTPTNWFDPCAFSLPQAGTYGKVGRNTLIGPGLANLDLALGKTFTLQRTDVTFKAEMFNVTNRANFGLPSAQALTAAGVANASAGLITYTTTSARQLQFALRVNF